MKNVWRICFGMCISMMCVLNSNAQNYVLNFDGTNDYVDIGTNAGDGVRTVELWFKLDAAVNNTLASPIALVTRNDATENDEFGLYFGPSTWSGKEGRLTFFRRDNGTLHDVVSNANSWAANQWHHVAGVIDPTGGMKLYIDCVLQSDVDASTVPTGTASEITTFGRWGNAAIRHFEGSLEEIRFWNRALSQAEIDSKKCTLLDPSSEAGLQAYWRLEEGTGTTTNDVTTNAYHGTINGATWALDSACPGNLNNYVLDFDGIDDYIDIGGNAGDGVRSIELWFKPDVAYDAALVNPVALVARNDATENDEFGIYVGPSSWAGKQGRIVFFRRDNGALHDVVSNGNSWAANEWHHVVGVIDPTGGMKLYIDCVLQSDVDASTVPTGTASEITTFGRWGNAAIRHFDGSLDEVRFWNRAISQSEIETKKCLALNPVTETGLQAYWRFEEGVGTVAHDLTTNNYDGTVNGALWLQDPYCAKDNHVLYYDGTNDYVDLGSDAGDGLRTVEMWFKPERQYDERLTAPVSLVVRNDGSEDAEFGLYIGPGSWAGQEGRLVFLRRDNGVLKNVVSNSAVWNADQWYHVAGVIDPTGGMRMYVDCVLQTDIDPSTAPTDTRVETTDLGRWGNLNIRFFDGHMDEVRFWSRALSQTEIDNKKCTILNPASETNLEGYWRFEEGSGTVAFDETTNSYDGIVSGAIWVQDEYCTSNKKSPFANASNRTIEQDGIQVYPNPFSDRLTIEFVTQENRDYSVLLYNATGQLVSQFTQVKEGEVTFETTNQASGIYYYQVLENGQSIHSGKAIMD